MGTAIAQPIPFGDIDGKRFAAFPNQNLYQKKKDTEGNPIAKSALDHVLDFTGTSSGVFRGLQLLERVTKAAALVLKEMGSAMAGFLENVAGKFTVAWCALAIPRLPEVTKRAKEAIFEWIHPPKAPPLDKKRDTIEKVHDIAEAAAHWGYAASFVTLNPAIKNMADVPNLVSDVTALQTSVQDWGEAKRHLEIINLKDPKNGPLQQRFADSMSYNLIKLTKETASVAGSVLGLMVLGFGAPVLPAAALLGISLTATLSAILAHFFQATRQYEPVDYFKMRKPEILVAGMAAV